MAQSANFLKQLTKLLTTVWRKKHIPESLSKSHRRKSGIYTETMAREVPAALQTGTQNRHRTATEKRRYNRYRVDRKRTINSRRFPVGSGTGSTLPNN